jgi:hypothetical protein
MTFRAHAAERFDLARLLSREASLARAVIVVEINSDADESRVTSLAAALGPDDSALSKVCRGARQPI